MSRRRNRRDAMYETAATQATTSARGRARSTPAATARAGRASPAARRAPSTRAAAASFAVLSSRTSTDWRNGSASDSSPEGYVFESRIGHSRVLPRRGCNRRYNTQVPDAPRVGRAPGPGHVRRGGRRGQDGGQAEGRDHPRGHHGRGDAVLGSPSVLNTTFYLASPAPWTGTFLWSPSTTTTPRPLSTRWAGAFGEAP